MRHFQIGQRASSKENRIDTVVKCLAIYFVMMPFDSFPVFGMGSLLKAIAFLPLIAIVILRKRSKIKINKLTITFLIYMLANAITCLYSVELSASLFELRRLVLNGILVIAVGGMYDQYNRDELNYLIKALILGGLATVVMTLLFRDTSSTGRLTLSVNGTKQDQNYINGYMYFAFAFFVNKIIGEKKLVYAVPSLFLIIFTLSTGSRGATVALIALGIMVFIYNMFNTGRIKLGVMIIAMIIVVALVFSFDYIMSLLPREVAIRFSSDFISNYTGTNRNVLWGAILNIFKEGSLFRKAFGYGYGTVPTVNTFNHLVAHNLWIDHLISGGVIGLFILINMQIVFVIEAWRQKNAVIFSAYMGYLVMCMTLSLINYKPIWNCMMMIMILSNMRSNECQKNWKPAHLRRHKDDFLYQEIAKSNAISDKKVSV